jgi:hypothetical protein
MSDREPGLALGSRGYTAERRRVTPAAFGISANSPFVDGRTRWFPLRPVTPPASMLAKSRSPVQGQFASAQGAFVPRDGSRRASFFPCRLLPGQLA